MNRRSFIKGILAAGIAPAIVKIERIMPIYPLTENYIVNVDTINYQEFTRKLLKEIAKSCGVPYSVLAGDLQVLDENPF